MSLGSDNLPSKLLLELLEGSFHSWEGHDVSVQCASINIHFIPDIVDDVIGSSWEDVIQSKVAVAATHKCLGTSRSIGLLAMICNTKLLSVV